MWSQQSGAGVHTLTQGGVNSQEKENTDPGEGGRVESTVRSRSTLTQGKAGGRGESNIQEKEYTDPGEGGESGVNSQET